MITNNISMTTTNPLHFGSSKNTSNNKDITSNFGEALNKAFDKVNNLELNSQNMQLKMITDPKSVNAHEVSLAQTQAELALSFTKSISSRLVNAFNELTTLK